MEDDERELMVCSHDVYFHMGTSITILSTTTTLPLMHIAHSC